VAIECNRLHAVQELVSQRASLDVPFERRETETIRVYRQAQGNSAFFADRHDDEQEVVHANESLTPFELACKLRHYDIARFLLTKNASYDRSKLSAEAIQTLNLAIAAPHPH
jgi:ankyrin repeat protein